MARKRRPTKISDRAGRLIFGGVWLGVGAIFLVIGLFVVWRTAERERRFEHQGETVQGRVLRKWITGSTGTRGRGSGRTYRVSYRFTTHDRQIIEKNTSVGRALWDRLVEQEEFAVLYLPSDVLSHRLVEQGAGWTFPVIFTSLGGVLSAAGALIMWKTPKQRRTRG